MTPRNADLKSDDMKLNITANDSGDYIISPPKITNSQVEEKPVRNNITNELYLTLASTFVSKRKKVILYVPLGY